MLLFSLFFLFFFCMVGVFCVEELRVISPADLKAKFANDGLIRESPALFGVPAYREARQGILVFAKPSNGCDTIDKTNWPQAPTPRPDKPDMPAPKVILVIDRGVCTFVTKVRNAEKAGAISVIVINDDPNSNFLPLMADDGTGKNIVTPSVLITKADGDILKNFFTSNPTATALMSLLYLLPRPDNRVEWDLFTSSWDPQTLPFKKSMIPVVQQLDIDQFFTPHYYIIDGSSLGCTSSGLPCDKQCSHQGRYCAVDPERDTKTGLDGKDVILQDLREHCLINYINDTYREEGHNQYLWFQFVTDFNQECYDVKNPELWRTDDCANKIFDRLKIDKNYISTCIANSGGADGNTANKILDSFLEDEATFGIYYIPAAFVNLAPYRGSFNCPESVTNDGKCGIVEAICQGFRDQPSQCLSDKNCPFGYNMDQCGKCGGEGLMDQCGVCWHKTDPNFDSKFNLTCIGCDGEMNSGKIYDACGVCGGDGKCPALSTGQIVGIVFGSLVSIGLLSAGVYVYMRRQNTKMREDIDSLLKQYLPLEGGVNQNQAGARLVETNDSDM